MKREKLLAQISANPVVTSILADSIFKPSLKQRITEVAMLNEDAKEFMDSVIGGVHRAAVIYGPPGMGKTHIVTNALQAHGLSEAVDFVVLRSHATPMMLYVWLYLMRKQGKFIVLDDCDGIITQETGLNLLKGATDNAFRQVGWASTQIVRNPINGKVIPNSFEFNGTVIITTNVRLAVGRGRTANHMDALRSRAAPCSLNLEHREDQYAQIFHMIVEKNYLANDPTTDITVDEQVELLKFLLENLDLPRRLDLRLPQIVAREIKSKKVNWERRARRLLEAA
jgi:hypothetical protein